MLFPIPASVEPRCGVDRIPDVQQDGALQFTLMNDWRMSGLFSSFPCPMRMLRLLATLTIAGLLACLVTGGVSAAAVSKQAASDGAAGGPPIRLLVVGDSLTAGYGLDRQDSFTVRLEQALIARGHRVRVLDGGVSGDTTAGGRARLGWALADDPDAVLLALGSNDGLRGLDPSATYAHLEAMLQSLTARDMPVLLAGMLAPRNLGASYGREFDAVYPRLATDHDVVFYPFFLEGVAMEPHLNQDDGIHPNAAGVDRMVDGILPSVEKLLALVDEKG